MLLGDRNHFLLVCVIAVKEQFTCTMEMLWMIRVVAVQRDHNSEHALHLEGGIFSKGNLRGTAEKDFGKLLPAMLNSKPVV